MRPGSRRSTARLPAAWRRRRLSRAVCGRQLALHVRLCARAIVGAYGVLAKRQPARSARYREVQHVTQRERVWRTRQRRHGPTQARSWRRRAHSTSGAAARPRKGGGERWTRSRSRVRRNCWHSSLQRPPASARRDKRDSRQRVGTGDGAACASKGGDEGVAAQGFAAARGSVDNEVEAATLVGVDLRRCCARQPLLQHDPTFRADRLASNLDPPLSTTKPRL